MSLLQELTPMTPEVRHSLLSAEGEIMPGICGGGVVCTRQSAKKAKGLTPVQKEVLEYVIHVGQTNIAQAALALGYSRSGVSYTLKVLAKREHIKKLDTPGQYASLTSKAKVVKVTVSQKIQDRAASVDYFSVSDLYDIAKKGTIRSTVQYMEKQGIIKHVSHDKWELVK